jgi:hypothetical protein
MLRNVSVSAALALVLSAGVQAAEEPDKVGITGKVQDENAKPVQHALVIVRDRDTNEAVQVNTDRHGKYKAWHLPGTRCSVQVVPPAKTGLAQAILSEVPADEGRHVVVSVHKGFAVHGRVVAQGKPVRGVRVRVSPKSGDTIHDGGETQTDWHGAFDIVLTPGEKVFEFSEPKRKGAGVRNLVFSVTNDSTMPDVVMIR